MALDRLLPHYETLGDGPVGQTRDEQRQDLALTLRQPHARARPELAAVQMGGGGGRAPGQCRVDDGLTRGDLLQMADQFLASHPLEQVPDGARAQRLEQVLLVVVHTEEDDPPGGLPIQEAAAQVESARAAQPYVAQHDIGIERGDHVLRLPHLGRVPDDADPAVVPGQHRLEAVEHHLVVIDEDQSQGTTFHAQSVICTHDHALPGGGVGARPAPP